MMNEVYTAGGREVRVIPRGWQHPKDGRGRHEPLLPAGYTFEDGEVFPTMPELSGLAPEQTEIAAYECVSEGTPISPAFPNSDAGRLALVRYCAAHCTTFADHRADAEAWAAVLFGNAAVAIDGRVVGEG
jgi:hypothetical protein